MAGNVAEDVPADNAKRAAAAEWDGQSGRRREGCAGEIPPFPSLPPCSPCCPCPCISLADAGPLCLRRRGATSPLPAVSPTTARLRMGGPGSVRAASRGTHWRGWGGPRLSGPPPPRPKPSRFAIHGQRGRCPSRPAPAASPTPSVSPRGGAPSPVPAVSPTPAAPPWEGPAPSGPHPAERIGADGSNCLFGGHVLGLSKEDFPWPGFISLSV